MAESEFDMNASLRGSFPGQKLGHSLSIEDLDRIISDVFPLKHQRKMARVIWDVCELSEGYFSADEVAGRLTYFVEKGVFAGYGNLTKWAFSEIGPMKSDD